MDATDKYRNSNPRQAHVLSRDSFRMGTGGAIITLSSFVGKVDVTSSSSSSKLSISMSSPRLLNSRRVRYPKVIFFREKGTIGTTASVKVCGLGTTTQTDGFFFEENRTEGSEG